MNDARCFVCGAELPLYIEPGSPNDEGLCDACGRLTGMWDEVVSNTVSATVNFYPGDLTSEG